VQCHNFAPETLQQQRQGLAPNAEATIEKNREPEIIGSNLT
jgi:hypothetical protein